MQCEEDIKTGADINDVLKQLGGFRDKHIDENDKVMRYNRHIMSLSFVLAIAGLLTAIIPQVSKELSM